MARLLKPKFFTFVTAVLLLVLMSFSNAPSAHASSIIQPLRRIVFQDVYNWCVNRNHAGAGIDGSIVPSAYDYFCENSDGSRSSVDMQNLAENLENGQSNIKAIFTNWNDISTWAAYQVVFIGGDDLGSWAAHHVYNAIGVKLFGNTIADWWAIDRNGNQLQQLTEDNMIQACGDTYPKQTATIFGIGDYKNSGSGSCYGNS